MRYLPHTAQDIQDMLQNIGHKQLDELFLTIPEACRRYQPMKLPEAMTEWELQDHINSLANKMAPSSSFKIYAGAGRYDHYIPSSVSFLLSRSEFLTSYTPYQPEMSQGTLQAIYEYQTLVTRLLGLEVANASLYDGASALAEALLMATRITKKKTIALSKSIHPNYRQVVKTYLKPTDYHIIEIPYGNSGSIDISTIENLDDLAVLAIQSPNYFGCIEPVSEVAKKTHDIGALLTVCFTEPLAYGLIKNPGIQGADIACGEGQSFGISQSFGGPGLGMFATKKEYVRSMPGRLVGRAKDRDGKDGFVLTLATREQHIRREKATSNICTNSSFCALTAAIYLASLGGSGLKSLARLNYDKAEYLKSELKTAGVTIRFSDPTFNEFVVQFPEGFESKYHALMKKNILAGVPISSDYPELKNCYVICVTETKSKTDLDILVREVTV